MNPTDRVIIYHVNPAFGPMYLCADGTLSSVREQAAEHYRMQAPGIIAGNWLVRRFEPIVEQVGEPVH